MSLYNMMCGVNPAAGRLLVAINLPPSSIPRFRDVWVDRDLTEVTVYTRTGGGNREGYKNENAVLCGHPLYLRDSDDDFDSTFANFTFRLPEEEKAKLLSEIDEAAKGDAEKKDHVLAVISETPREKFDKAMEALKADL